MLVYRCIHNLTSTYLRNLCELKPPREGLRSVSNMHRLVVSLTKHKAFATLSFSVAGLAWWNNLPNYIKLYSTTDVFENKLRRYLFTRYHEEFM